MGKEQEQRREEEKVLLAVDISQGVAALLQKPHHDYGFEYGNSSYEILFKSIEGEVPAFQVIIEKSEEERAWVDPNQYSGPITYERIAYTFQGPDVVKEGSYDLSEKDGLPSVSFLITRERINTAEEHFPLVEYSVSPPIGLRELRWLKKIVQNPEEGLASVRKLPYPSTWPRPLTDADFSEINYD